MAQQDDIREEVVKKENEKPIEKLGKVPLTKAVFPELMSRGTCKPLEQDLGSMEKVPEEVLEMCVQPDALSSSPAAATPTAATSAAATAVSGGAAGGAAGRAPGLVGPRERDKEPAKALLVKSSPLVLYEDMPPDDFHKLVMSCGHLISEDALWDMIDEVAPAASFLSMKTMRMLEESLKKKLQI